MNKIGLKLSLLAFVIFFAIAGGGCGGSGGGVQEGYNPDSDNDSGGGGGNVQFTVLDDKIHDSDGDGVPDVLDFNDISQKYYGENDTVQGIKISSIPSRHYLRKFKGNASFSADLTAGTEYTVEISEGAEISGVTEVASYAYPIGLNLPDVEILNPQGNALEFLDFGTFGASYDASAVIDLSDDVIELSVYPADNPYIICCTFTPSVTGSYTIKLGRTSSDDTAADNELEHVTTLFIYEELRDGTDRNEAGHYRRYKIKDADGSTSETVSMTDIMELRKAYNSPVYDTLSAVWQLDGADSDDVTKDDWRKTAADSDAQTDAYFKCLARLKEHYGIFDGEDKQDNQKQIVEGIVDENDEDDETESSEAVSSAASGNSNAAGTNIKQELYGIPYTDDFQPGVGYFGITGVQATRNAIKRFTLPPLDPNSPDRKQVISRYTASFVSSQEEREKISTTTTGASLAIGGFGLSASYSSTSKFKFGLTSTTFVIHYEEVEKKYRVLNDEKYKLRNNAKKTLGESIPKFRENYGDYFVGGYKYGGTYDAFITITTQTMEQLEKVKSKLSAGFGSGSFSVGGNVGNETEETLKNNNATVNIQIITAGIDVSAYPDIPKAGDQSKTLNMNDVVKSLTAFRAALKKSKPSDYMPVYVMLKRYTLLDDYDEEMDKQKDKGLIPISPQHARKITAFNRQKLIMDSYYNVISDLTNQQIDGAVRDSFTKEYREIGNEITIGGNSFYAESNSARMDELKKKMENISGRLKALGDRYVFYQRLMSLQKKEKNYSAPNINYKPFGENGGSIGVTTFAVSTAVTSDIAAGKHDYGDKKNESPSFWGHIEWSPAYTAQTKDGSSEAVFCYIQVTANNTNDLNRDVTNSPCVAKNQANFYFQSGGTRWGEWETKLWSMRFRRDDYPFGGLE